MKLQEIETRPKKSRLRGRGKEWGREKQSRNSPSLLSVQGGVLGRRNKGGHSFQLVGGEKEIPRVKESNVTFFLIRRKQHLPQVAAPSTEAPRPPPSLVTPPNLIVNSCHLHVASKDQEKLREEQKELLLSKLKLVNSQAKCLFSLSRRKIFNLMWKLS